MPSWTQSQTQPYDRKYTVYEVYSALGKDTTDGVRIRQKFSKGTFERRNLAMIKRRSLKDGEGANWKMFVKYPATLMAKPPDSRNYRVVEEF